MNYIERRVKEEASEILKTKKTIRQLAEDFHVSKSTVHKDLHERLKKIDKKTFIKVDEILQYHQNIKHIRGGNSTRLKYLKMEELCSQKI